MSDLINRPRFSGPAPVGVVMGIIAVLMLFAGIFISSGTVWAADGALNGRASAPQVYSMMRNSRIELVDIRRPQEWQQTGVGSGAHRISMHQSGFVKRIDTLLGGDRSRPVALICARGVRSAHMKAQLNALGFTNVTNVSEGMLGSQAGPGWLKRKLPTRK